MSSLVSCSSLLALMYVGMYLSGLAGGVMAVTTQNDFVQKGVGENRRRRRTYPVPSSLALVWSISTLNST